jgi:DNA-binding transcriptional LysR family regulator
MNLVNLQTFLKVIETGSLVRASESLNVTQSTVTARLKALEDELGQTLLNRHKSGATLTAPGYKLKRYAEVMVGLWRQARLETSLPDEIDYVCNIACHMDLWFELGKTLITRLRREHPGTAFSVWPGEQTDLDKWLGFGLVDAALSYQPVVHGNQSVHALSPDMLEVYTTRPGSPARFDPDYIYVDSGDVFQKQHDAIYADAGVAKVSFGCAVWALEYLLENGGSAYLPQRMAAPHLAAGRLHRVEDAPPITRNTYLVTNDTTIHRWPALTSLIDKASSAQVSGQ